MTNPNHWVNRQIVDGDFTNDTFPTMVANCTFLRCNFSNVVFLQESDANDFVDCVGIIRFILGGEWTVVHTHDGQEINIWGVPAMWYLNVETGDVSEFLQRSS